MDINFKRLTFSRTWPDILAFACGLAMAWFLEWQTKDLVWGLWLSSLLVGYTTIIISILKGLDTRNVMTLGGTIFAAVFFLSFFTVHFGMFHFVHSVFLNMFFPVGMTAGLNRVEPSLAVYQSVLLAYWPFVILTLIAERHKVFFQNKPNNFVAPYLNVIRMHLLIFFFAGAAAINLESFVVYAVVYFLYFFPWRLLSNKTEVPVQPAHPSSS